MNGYLGVETVDAKLTHLAYAPEIAQVMLRRQQAQAIISARAQIVRGAVGMVEEALRGLAEREIVELDSERKAATVSNLRVVLCSDRETQPIVNAGALYNQVKESTGARRMASPGKKSYPLRIDPALWGHLQRLAATTCAA